MIGRLTGSVPGSVDAPGSPEPPDPDGSPPVDVLGATVPPWLVVEVVGWPPLVVVDVVGPFFPPPLPPFPPPPLRVVVVVGPFPPLAVVVVVGPFPPLPVVDVVGPPQPPLAVVSAAEP